MGVGIFIPVRIGSTRLPQKALMRVNGKCILEYLIERIKFVNEKSAKIMICTTDLKEDLVLDDLADRNSIGIFHGETENILKRQYDCARIHDIDFIVNVDGDDILCNPEYINKIINEHHKKPNYDVIQTEGLPFGTNSMGYQIGALEKIMDILEQKKIDTGWGEIIKDEMLFHILKLHANFDESIEARLTLDYIEDFKVFENIIQAIFEPGKYLKQSDIITYLRRHPEVLKTNHHLNETYWQNYNKCKWRKSESNEQ